MNGKKNKRVLRIELSTGPLILMSFLAGASLITSFYLGFFTGKSVRVPESQLAVKQNLPILKQNANLDHSPQNTFFELSDTPKESTESIVEFGTTTPEERLRAIQKKTEELEDTNLGQGLTATQSSSTPTVTTPSPVSESSPSTTQTSITKENLVPTPVETLYTVQVSSSRSKEISEELVNRLKKRGFSSYMQTYISPAGTTFYRVRVGRNEKTIANTQAKKLKQLNFIDSVQVTRL